MLTTSSNVESKYTSNKLLIKCQQALGKIAQLVIKSTYIYVLVTITFYQEPFEMGS